MQETDETKKSFSRCVVCEHDLCSKHAHMLMMGITDAPVGTLYEQLLWNNLASATFCLSCWPELERYLEEHLPETDWQELLNLRISLAKATEQRSPAPPIEGDLNPGIRLLVKLLRDAGFDTCDSGDGQTHDYECNREHAYVSIRVADANVLSLEAERLMSLIEVVLKVKLHPQGEGDHPCIQATYDPVDKIGIVELWHVTDADISENLAASLRGEETPKP
jgi:hypothetical protein